VETHGALEVGLLNGRDTAALAQIIQPCRAMESLDPLFRPADVPGQRPSIAPVPHSSALDGVHRTVEVARQGGVDKIFDLDHDRAASIRNGECG
jgi:hypothetical protein